MIGRDQKANDRCTLRSSPIGRFGLDSSLIASITARHLSGTKAAKQRGAQLHSFSVGLEGSPDLIAAREVADYLATIHHEFHFSVQDIDAIEDVINHRNIRCDNRQG